LCASPLGMLFRLWTLRTDEMCERGHLCETGAATSERGDVSRCSRINF